MLPAVLCLKTATWTPADGALVGDFGSGQALTDDQFRLLVPLIPPTKPGGRPRTTDIRNLLDGLFYLVRTGCQWCHLPPPPAFPPWREVYGYLRAFLRDSVWESIRRHFLVALREGAGREVSPTTAAIADTKSAKTTESGGPRGWDAAKRLKGRKRHIAVDPDGLLLGVVVHAADIQDADSVGDLLKRVKPLYAWLRVVFADSIYNRLAAVLACFLAGLVLIIVRCAAGTTGFVVQPRRWVIERSLGWFSRWRRLSKDHEALPEVAEAMVTLARSASCCTASPILIAGDYPPHDFANAVEVPRS